jgi:hypothetical protein
MAPRVKVKRVEGKNAPVPVGIGGIPGKPPVPTGMTPVGKTPVRVGKVPVPVTGSKGRALMVPSSSRRGSSREGSEAGSSVRGGSWARAGSSVKDGSSSVLGSAMEGSMEGSIMLGSSREASPVGVGTGTRGAGRAASKES